MWRPRQWLVVGVSLLGLTACATSEHIAEIGTTSSAPIVVPHTPHPASTVIPPTAPPITPEPPSTAPQTVPTIEPSSHPPTADPRRIKGIVYSIQLPRGWQDFSSQVQGS